MKNFRLLTTFVLVLFAASAQAEDSLRIGSTVITRNGNRGVVTRIKNGSYIVRYNNADNPHSRSFLAKTDGTSAGLSVNGTAITRNGNKGTVAGIFPNGELSVFYNNSYNTHSRSFLAQTYGTSAGLSINGTAITRNGNKGTVAGIFQNGELSVFYNNSYNTHSRSFLAKTYGTSAGLSVNGGAITRNGNRGTVGGIFDNGELSVFYNNSYNTHSRSFLTGTSQSVPQTYTVQVQEPEARRAIAMEKQASTPKPDPKPKPKPKPQPKPKRQEVRVLGAESGDTSDGGVESANYSSGPLVQ